MAPSQFKIASSPQPKLAFSNRVYVSKSSFNALGIAARSQGVHISSADPSVNLAVGPWIFQARLISVYNYVYIYVYVCIAVGITIISVIVVS